jgi:6-phosphogluconolactonase
MTVPASRIMVSPDPDALAAALADWLLKLALAKQDLFSLCLSGGSTPKALYRKLAEPAYAAFPWALTHLFWGDERFVPPDDDLSNFKMVREALLSHAPIPPQNIHAVPTVGMSPEAAASLYQRELQSFYGAGRLEPDRALFDVNLLGLGEDGHTASLFPGTATLGERDHWVAAVVGAKAEARITLTYPALDSSRHVAFLAAGAAKAPMLARLIAGDRALPAAGVDPIGDLWIFCDAAAREPS